MPSESTVAADVLTARGLAAMTAEDAGLILDAEVRTRRAMGHEPGADALERAVEVLRSASPGGVAHPFLLDRLLGVARPSVNILRDLGKLGQADALHERIVAVEASRPHRHDESAPTATVALPADLWNAIQEALPELVGDDANRAGLLASYVAASAPRLRELGEILAALDEAAPEGRKIADGETWRGQVERWRFAEGEARTLGAANANLGRWIDEAVEALGGVCDDLPTMARAAMRRIDELVGERDEANRMLGVSREAHAEAVAEANAGIERLRSLIPDAGSRTLYEAIRAVVGERDELRAKPAPVAAVTTPKPVGPRALPPTNEAAESDEARVARIEEGQNGEGRVKAAFAAAPVLPPFAAAHPKLEVAPLVKLVDDLAQAESTKGLNSALGQSLDRHHMSGEVVDLAAWAKGHAAAIKGLSRPDDRREYRALLTGSVNEARKGAKGAKVV